MHECKAQVKTGICKLRHKLLCSCSHISVFLVMFDERGQLRNTVFCIFLTFNPLFPNLPFISDVHHQTMGSNIHIQKGNSFKTSFSQLCCLYKCCTLCTAFIQTGFLIQHFWCFLASEKQA